MSFIQPVAPFFETIKNIVHLFYNRTIKVDQDSIDFSFLIATFIMLGLVYGLKFVVEYIHKAEYKFEKIHKAVKNKHEEIFNAALEKEYIKSESKNNKFLVVIKFSASNAAKDSFFDKDSEVGVEEIEKEVINEFMNDSTEILKYQKKVIRDYIILNFNDFEAVDRTISLIKGTVKDIAKKHSEERWKISSFISLDVYAEESEIIPKAKKMVQLVKLGFNDMFVCTSSFKQRYSIQKNPRYTIEHHGTYTINQQKEDVFSIKSLI